MGWSETYAQGNQATLVNLSDSTAYEYRVGAPCGDGYAYGALQTFTTHSAATAANSYQCGVLPKAELSNTAPLPGRLFPGDVFMAGDFPITVLSAQGQDGAYSGSGVTHVPYLADTKLKVTFTDITLNTDKRLIAGAVETTLTTLRKAPLCRCPRALGRTSEMRG